eukprot:278906-Ditylum_brightwellii.AAC.1
MNLQQHYGNKSVRSTANIWVFSSSESSDQENTQEDDEISDDIITEMTTTTTKGDTCEERFIISRYVSMKMRWPLQKQMQQAFDDTIDDEWGNYGLTQ